MCIHVSISMCVFHSLYPRQYLHVRIPFIFHRHHTSICSVLKTLFPFSLSLIHVLHHSQMENLSSRSNTCLFTEKCEEDRVKNHFSIMFWIHADEVTLNLQLEKWIVYLFTEFTLSYPVIWHIATYQTTRYDRPAWAILARLRVRRPTVCSSTPGRSKRHFCLLNVQTENGAHPAPTQWTLRALSLDLKQRGMKLISHI
jgi:hypothetical protein